MGLLGWFKKRSGQGEDARLLAWRRSWNAAAAADDTSAVETLSRELDALGLAEEDIEIEREMLGALRDLADLAASVQDGGLPTIATGHHVGGDERCHFTAPVSMPDEVSQPGGRLLLTNRRALFLGGAAARAVPWHRVREALPVERDLVLIRNDQDTLYRFRCNSFSDALRSAFLARQLKRTPGRSPQDL